MKSDKSWDVSRNKYLRHEPKRDLEKKYLVYYIDWVSLRVLTKSFAQGKKIAMDNTLKKIQKNPEKTHFPSLSYPVK